MAPSRGLPVSGSQRVLSRCACTSRSPCVARRSFRVLSTARSATPPTSTLLPQRRCTLSSFRIGSDVLHTATHGAVRAYSSFTDKLADPANRLQSYVSRSDDPYLNLSIEDHILRKSPADSTVLFLYVNRPCVVIGRNQNPWTEVNLGMLDAARDTHDARDSQPPDMGTVDLVRRRSGGGAVFHDEGNLNWSITCPRGDFTRDKHAEMVVRALRRLGVDRARVNERHDIVLDQGRERHTADAQDTHRTPYTTDQDGPRPLKVSGSAYKLTRQRALHHATTLLSSPNLHVISDYLRSPAKHLIHAQGVESVSSPVSNIGLDVGTFQERLQDEFASMYAELGTPSVVETVGDEHLDIPDIRKGYDELQTDEWMWSQTPRFSLVLDPKDDVGLQMEVHHGVIKTLEFDNSRLSDHNRTALRAALVGIKLQDVWNSDMILQISNRTQTTQLVTVARRLQELLPVPKLSMR